MFTAIGVSGKQYTIKSNTFNLLSLSLSLSQHFLVAIVLSGPIGTLTAQVFLAVRCMLFRLINFVLIASKLAFTYTSMSSDNEIILFIQRSHFFGMQFENILFFFSLCSTIMRFCLALYRKTNNVMLFIGELRWSNQFNDIKWKKKNSRCAFVKCLICLGF